MKSIEEMKMENAVKLLEEEEADREENRRHTSATKIQGAWLRFSTWRKIHQSMTWIGKTINIQMKQSLKGVALEPAVTCLPRTGLLRAEYQKKMVAMSHLGTVDIEGNSMMTPLIYGPHHQVTPDIEIKARKLRFHLKVWIRCMIKRLRYGVKAEHKPVNLPSVERARSLNNGDGLVTGLYRSVWEKNSYEQSCEGVLIPDTVVIRHHKLENWYFLAKDKQLRKKKKRNITLNQIYQSFTKAEQHSQRI